MRCRLCNVTDGQRIQRAADGSSRWRAVAADCMGDKEWFPSQTAAVKGGLCNGKVCGDREKKDPTRP